MVGDFSNEQNEHCQLPERKASWSLLMDGFMAVTSTLSNKKDKGERNIC
jgi:hypothetical protein